MSVFHFPDSSMKSLNMTLNQDKLKKLVQGEILLQTRSHTLCGAAVTAWIYLPLGRSQVWQQITNYPRWVEYFPDFTKSEILSKGEVTKLYQTAQKSFFFFTAEVEIYLNVREAIGQKVQFEMEKGTFEDFQASLELQDYTNGTILAYSVQATPNIPIPSIFIQQAISLELPANMRKMRQVICNLK